MKYTVKKAFAILLAALLALPLQSIAFAEDALDLVIEDTALDEGIELYNEDIEAPALDMEKIQLGDLGLQLEDSTANTAPPKCRWSRPSTLTI